MEYTKCTLCKMDGKKAPAIGKYIANDDNLYYICSKCAKLVEKERYEIRRLS